MLIATSLSVASALLLSSALAAPPTVTPPPLVIGVTVAVDISPTLIPRVLAEAESIWRTAGVVIVWEREGGIEMHAPMLRVWIGGAKGLGSQEQAMPLGWIGFDEDGTPTRNIYVSHTNALTLLNMTESERSPSRMPRAELETLLGRAMGRALAHELGHFLLTLKGHTETGLMRARRTSTEFFSRDSSRLALDQFTGTPVRNCVASAMRVGSACTS